jgi:allantoicase
MLNQHQTYNKDTSLHIITDRQIAKYVVGKKSFFLIQTVLLNNTVNCRDYIAPDGWMDGWTDRRTNKLMNE